MNSRPISASSLKTFLQCKFKYHSRYEDKKPRVEKSDPLAFGTAVHEALELMHQLVSDSGQPPTKEVYDAVIEKFMTSAVANGLEDLTLFEEGKDIMMSRLDKVSHEDNILGLELGFELETPNGTPFLGSIDKLIEIDSDTVAVIDYKTSRTALTQDEADADIQFSMYDLAVSMMFPQYKNIVCAFDYIRLTPVMTHRTEDQRATFVNLLDACYSEILKTEREDAKPAINKFCGWCEFKNFCPSYSRMLNEPGVLLPVPSELSDSEFVEAFDILAEAKRIVNSRDRELKSEAYKRLKHNSKVPGNGKHVYKTQGGRRSFDTMSVSKLVPKEDFVKLVSVNTRSVENYLKQNPDKRDDFEKSSQFSYNQPTFRIKKGD